MRTTFHITSGSKTVRMVLHVSSIDEVQGITELAEQGFCRQVGINDFEFIIPSTRDP